MNRARKTQLKVARKHFCKDSIVMEEAIQMPFDGLDGKRLGAFQSDKDNADIMKIWCKDCRTMFSSPADPAIFKHNANHEIIFDFTKESD